jgi:hypothetical protein
MKSKLRKTYASGSTRRLIERIESSWRIGRAPLPKRTFLDESGNPLPTTRKANSGGGQ